MFKCLTGRLLVKRNKCTMVCEYSGDPVKIICGDPDADTEKYERKGAVEVLWDTFGGTETEKGYKVLDEHVGLIYGTLLTMSVHIKFVKD